MALPNTNINPGSPPLLWSNIYEAFTRINENFTSLDIATGGTAVDLSTLNTSVSPADDGVYQLGDPTHKWKSLFTAEYSTLPGSEFNGVWMGTAHIKGQGSTVELPFGSTVAGVLIKDPTRIFFKEIQVDNLNNIVAVEGTNSVGLNSGTAMQLVVDSSAESITFNNTGVTSVVNGSGISVSSSTGDVTISNTGVTSLTNTTTLPSGRTSGAGINVSASTGGVSLTNTGVLSIEAGSAALTVSTDAATGIVTITNAAPAGNTFRYVIINSDSVSPIEANNVNGVLNFAAGAGITLAKSTSTDTVTITVNPVFDLKGSIFGDDSSLLVDAVSNKFYGELVGTVVGNADTATLASTATTVTLVATETTAATHYLTFVDTATGNENLRTDTSLNYNPGTNTLTSTSFAGTLTGNIFTNLIDSADSSAITITPKVIFSSDIDIENELRVRGSLMISVAQLKTIAAASTDFTAFKAAIAALTA